MIKGCFKNHKFNIFFGMILILVSIILVLLFSATPSFADMFNDRIASGIRYVLSLLTGWFSFSLFEVFLLCLFPMVAILLVFVLIRKIRLSSLLVSILSIVSVLLFVFVSSFGVCYFCSPLEERMELDRKPIDRKELYDCSEIVKESLYSSLDDVSYSAEGGSVNPHSWYEADNLIDKGFDKIRTEYDFVSSNHSVAKQIVMSKPMTYTHISGIYMPLTGEANVNTNYPDYVVVYSMAHEKAHQRGIASEDEANFVGFLALINSGDAYLEYCAYMSMYDYFLDSMYKYDSEMYYYLISNVDKRVLGEMYAYSVFFDKYRNSKASKVADSVNDTYIKAMGDEKGVDSYGLVVELMCAYIKEKALQ